MQTSRDDSSATPRRSDEDFEALARRALAEIDAPPADAATLAKLAFELRDIPVVELDDQLVGVRSGTSTGSTHRAQHDREELAWSVEGQRLAGVYSGAFTRMMVQTSDTTEVIDFDTADGTFEGPVPAGPYRLLVENAEARWATGWVSDFSQRPST